MCSGSDTALQSKLKHRMIGDYKSGGLAWKTSQSRANTSQ